MEKWKEEVGGGGGRQHHHLLLPKLIKTQSSQTGEKSESVCIALVLATASCFLYQLRMEKAQATFTATTTS